MKCWLHSQVEQLNSALKPNASDYFFSITVHFCITYKHLYFTRCAFWSQDGRNDFKLNKINMMSNKTQIEKNRLKKIDHKFETVGKKKKICTGHIQKCLRH